MFPRQRREHLQQSCMAHKAHNVFCLAIYRKHWLTSDLYRGWEAWALPMGPPPKGLQWHAHGAGVSQSSRFCPQPFVLRSCSLTSVSAHCNSRENWLVSTRLHAGASPAKAESTKQAPRKWNKLERCFLFIRFKWELCFLANSQCGQVTVFAGTIFFPLF